MRGYLPRLTGGNSHPERSGFFVGDEDGRFGSRAQQSASMIETHILQSIEKFSRMLDEETVQATRRAIEA
jgi:hypothetical protein